MRIGTTVDGFQRTKEELTALSRDLRALLARAGEELGLDGDPLKDWDRQCAKVDEQVRSQVIRVAVVGTIKSGKSTFSNTLLGGDYLRRGAGVVTSIVTRVRRGKSLGATLTFKSWGEINRELNHAAAALPPAAWEEAGEPLDLRRPEDRRRLGAALERLKPDQLIRQDARDRHSLFLINCLKGYGEIADIVSENPVEKIFGPAGFWDHQRFVGEDFLAVYLKDVLLTVGGGALPRDVELADCQGSDSPNPLHLAMIQEYLLSTHLILYVISARTGLRQADIKFLSIIQRMGILGGTLFVLNVDLGEHEGAAEIREMAAGLARDLEILVPAPRIYTLSALYNLLRSLDDPPERERFRLRQWELDAASIAFSDTESERFEADLSRKISEDRQVLLLANALERLGGVAEGVARWLSVRRDLLSKDEGEAEKVGREIGRYRERIDAMRGTVRAALGGTSETVKSEVKRSVDRFFDRRNGAPVKKMYDYIDGYQVADGLPEEGNGNLANAMHRAFQEFKQGVETYAAEAVNPEIFGFIKGEEASIASRFASVVDPYETMLREVVEEYNAAASGMGMAPVTATLKGIPLPDVRTLKASHGLRPPMIDTAFGAGRRVRTETLARFGIYSLLNALKRIFRRPFRSDAQKRRLAVAEGVRRLKVESRKELDFRFKDYRENLKYQYLLKLVDRFQTEADDAVGQWLKAHGTDLTGIDTLVHRHRSDRRRLTDSLGGMAGDAAGIRSRIDRLRTVAPDPPGTRPRGS